MFSQSLKRKIVGIALGLIILMVATSILSFLMARKVSYLLDELTNKYIPAYGHLARTDIRSLERALALRQMVIAKMQTPTDDAGYSERLRVFQNKGPEIDQEAQAARKLIGSIINDVNTPSDNVELTRIDSRIEGAVTDLRRHMDEEGAQLLGQLEASPPLLAVDQTNVGISKIIDEVQWLPPDPNDRSKVIEPEPD